MTRKCCSSQANKHSLRVGGYDSLKPQCDACVCRCTVIIRVRIPVAVSVYLNVRYAKRMDKFKVQGDLKRQNRDKLAID